MTITHRVVNQTGPAAVPGSLSDIASQLSGMAAQVSALASAGVGLPGLNSTGGQISSLATSMSATLTAAGNTSAAAIATQIAGIGTQIASSGMTGMAGLATSLSGLASQLSGLMNSSALAQTLHQHILDKIQGITHSAFQGQHIIKLLTSGIVHQSIAMVQHMAPQIPVVGNLLGSDTATFTKGITALGFNVSSDERLKSNIEAYEASIDAFMQAAVKTFVKRHIHTVAHDDGTVTSEVGKDEGVPSFGFIAQEIQKLFPEIVGEVNGFLTVDEGKLGFIVWVVLQDFIAQTRAATASMRSEIDALKEEMRQLKNG
jgi:Chaperone of endosialidase